MQRLRRRSAGIALIGSVLIGLAGITIGFRVLAQESTETLAPLGLEVGGALHSYPGYFPPQDLRDLAEFEFTAITASLYMPFGVWTDPTNDPDISGWEQLVDWALQRDLKVHGHSLLYPSANSKSDWWNELPDELVEPFAREFIEQTVSARKGKIWVWDVVNEVIADDGIPMDAQGLRTDVKEYSAIGPDYVDKAFRWAAAKDPDAILIITDYGTEPESNKSDRLLSFAKRLRDRGVPIDGVGFQMHYFDPDSEPDYDSIRRNFQRFAAAGFRIFITEMDVVASRGASDAQLPTAAQQNRQRRIYEAFTRIAVEQPAVEALFLWDFVDQESWLHPARSNNGPIRTGEYTFPSIFRYQGDEIVAKPAYFGMQRALRRFAK